MFFFSNVEKARNCSYTQTCRYICQAWRLGDLWLPVELFSVMTAVGWILKWTRSLFRSDLSLWSLTLQQSNDLKLSAKAMLKIFKPSWKLLNWSSQSLGLNLTKQEFHVLKGTKLPKQAQTEFADLAGLQQGKYSVCGLWVRELEIFRALYKWWLYFYYYYLFLYFFACSFVQLLKCKVYPV